MNIHTGMDQINFKVNGVQHKVGCEVSSKVTLVDYLREHLEYRGTKYMCREGGCGACIVVAVKSPGGPILAVNACMISITSCQDWEITTIEGLGNRKKGYHILQKTLANYNGSQCGYCSPGWVMNMHSLLQNGNQPTMLEIEKTLTSNICRCTGYRSILKAFKKFGSDSPKTDEILDIEDLNICKKLGHTCNEPRGVDNDDEDWCILDIEDSNIIQIQLKDDKCWYKVYDLNSIYSVLDKVGYDSYMLVFGNTAKGAYPIDEYPDALIDITSVKELKAVKLDQNLVIGAGLTITEVINIFQTVAKEKYFEYLDKLNDHLKLVAHIAVRNLGSIGGNLMIKHQHNDFPSDIFLLFETVGAYLTIMNNKGIIKKLTMQQFLKEDMKGKVIINALLPPLNETYKLFRYKVMPRSQNAHAIVNAGFLFKLSKINTVMEARMVYGGLSPSFTRAATTERFLLGKPLFTNETLQSALTILEKEVVVTENRPEPSIEYRKHLALALFYKGLINICPRSILNKRYLSESTSIHETRPVSHGIQVIDTKPALWPLNQPIPKVEGLIQCAGETKYTDDLPTQPHEVYAAFVLTTVALGDIVSIDAERALKLPGVIAFYTSKDIPGLNTFIPEGLFYKGSEEVFCSGMVKYYNQPYGIVVAESQHKAEAAAKMVIATYKNIKNPIIDVKKTKNDPTRVEISVAVDATATGTDVIKEIRGENTIYGQYHFMMENIGCVTRPTEEGIEVYATTQSTDGTQVMISQALNIDENRIDVHVRRLGGAFGMKLTRAHQVAVACSLVTQKINRPCRFMLPLTTNTRAIGKRFACHNDYVCKVNSKGVIQNVDYTLYEDNGYVNTEVISVLSRDLFFNCYNKATWNFKCYDVTTDNAKNVPCRAPGSLENNAMAEHLLERISYELTLDPFDVRMANLDTANYKDLIEMAENLKSSASYVERKTAVNVFNTENRWRKRGLRCSFLRWHCFGSLVLEVNLSVFHADGTVIITHGGIEMGQGINTKAIQIAAYFLKIPIGKIQVKANNTIIAPNCTQTFNSIGSQNVGIGVRRCCEELIRRLEPIRKQMTNPTWEDLIKKAFESDVDLQVHNYVGASDAAEYDLYGVALAEVEIDVLTGESEVLRVDLLQDVGQSVSPEIDIGQIEGAFIMGLGYWTCENLVYNRVTGELLSDRTWNLHVPLARDIPQDFRINFRKNSYSYPRLLGAKATGEPSICLSISTAFALREAIAEARHESGISKTNWFQIDGPFTVEKIALASVSLKKDYKLC